MRRRVVAAMLAGAAGAGTAQAAVQVVSYSGNGGAVAMMRLFDASLGTLQAASIQATYSNAIGFASYGFLPPDQPVTGVFQLGSLSFALNGMTTTTLDSGPFGTFTVAGSGGATFADTGQLRALTGSTLALVGQAYVPPPGQPLGGSPIANVGYRVSYTYDDGLPLPGGSGAVPEPASWAMLIAGFGLTGAALRRARRTAAVARPRA